jgi:hypothetical protein
MNTATIATTMTMQEALHVCMILTKGDPFGVFTGDFVKRVDASARRTSQEANKPQANMPAKEPVAP